MAPHGGAARGGAAAAAAAAEKLSRRRTAMLTVRKEAVAQGRPDREDGKSVEPLARGAAPSTQGPVNDYFQ